MAQSWIKAHDSSKNTFWENYPSIDSPITDNELNRNEVSVDTIDDRVITLDTIKAEQADLLLTFKAVSFDSTTGVFTFTKWNNTTVTVDTDIEKIAINFDYDDDPTSPHYQNLVIELDDGTYKYVDMSALITQYEFTDSSTIDFTVANDGTVTATVIDGSITESKLQPNFLADCRAAKTGAENAEADAIAKALVSEGYANGKQNGVPVTSGSPYYENNAEYFKNQASSIVGSKVDSFNGRTGVVTSQTGDYTQDQIGVPSTASVGQVPIVRNVGGSNVFVMETPAEGLKPHFVITSDTGSTVTVTKGGTTYTATETSTGIFECNVNDYGTWTVSSVLNGDTYTTTVNVDDVKIYTINALHFHATVNVSYPSGYSCTISNGTETIVATSSPYAFVVHFADTYTITTEDSQQNTYTETVTITTDGEVVNRICPNGTQLLPTDDIGNWLFSGGRSETYTTLNEVLADSTCLSALISSNNAMDYLARSTTFASGICANSTAMSYIGLNNYASDTLLEDIDWVNAITSSSYWSSVLNVTVPTMTGNTSPSGECFADQGNSTAYLAFNKSNWTSGGNTYWNGSTTGTYVGYDFGVSVKVVKIDIAPFPFTSSDSRIKGTTMRVKGSDTSSDYQNVSNSFSSQGTTAQLYTNKFANSTKYKRYIVTVSGGTWETGERMVRYIQFYGRKDV